MFFFFCGVFLIVPSTPKGQTFDVWFVLSGDRRPKTLMSFLVLILSNCSVPSFLTFILIFRQLGGFPNQIHHPVNPVTIFGALKPPGTLNEVFSSPFLLPETRSPIWAGSTIFSPRNLSNFCPPSSKEPAPLNFQLSEILHDLQVSLQFQPYSVQKLVFDRSLCLNTVEGGFSIPEVSI